MVINDIASWVCWVQSTVFERWVMTGMREECAEVIGLMWAAWESVRKIYEPRRLPYSPRALQLSEECKLRSARLSSWRKIVARLAEIGARADDFVTTPPQPSAAADLTAVAAAPASGQTLAHLLYEYFRGRVASLITIIFIGLSVATRANFETHHHAAPRRRRRRLFCMLCEITLCCIAAAAAADATCCKSVWFMCTRRRTLDQQSFFSCLYRAPSLSHSLRDPIFSSRLPLLHVSLEHESVLL